VFCGSTFFRRIRKAAMKAQKDMMEPKINGSKAAAKSGG
jgi:hypothetical protein